MLAAQHLKRAHLTVANVVPRPSSQFPAGQVTNTNPGTARSVSRGTAVTLFVSSGPQTVSNFSIRRVSARPEEVHC